MTDDLEAREAELREVLHRSALAMATFDLDDMSFVDANVAARALVGLDEHASLPEKLSDIVLEAKGAEPSASLRLLADGEILAFEAQRHLRCVNGTMISVHCWVESVDFVHAHTALIVFAPWVDAHDAFSADLPGTRLRLSGPVVVGSLDLDMRMQRLGNDIVELLGEEPETMLGQPLVERLHRDDVGAFLLGLGRAMADDNGTAMHVRIRHANGDFIPIRLVVTPTSGEPGTTRLGIVMTTEHSDSANDARVGELERHLWRIALEVQAAGVVDGLQRLPDPSQVPGLADLSSRQWDIVTRLLKGDRVPAIVRATFVSQSTVRNQLGTIYQKVGVHSQTELLSLLRGSEGQTVSG